MTRTEIIRQRRLMNRRIREAVAERRLAHALRPAAGRATDEGQEPTAGTQVVAAVTPS